MPSRPFYPLLLWLSRVTESQLAQAFEYVLAENRILRAKLPKQVHVTPVERRQLLKLGRPLGTALKHLITVVSYTSFLRWKREQGGSNGAKHWVGRPPTNEEARALILRMARENGWGYTRILGEINKLKVKGVSRTTIKNILRAEGLYPAPVRPYHKWSDFIQRHAETLWACDYLTSRILTAKGFADCFVLFYIHIATRRVHVAGVTVCPHAEWIAQQARNVCMHFDEYEPKPTLVLHDADGKFTPMFKTILEAAGHTPIRLPIRSPNMNAFAERWVQLLRRECPDHFLILGEDYMRHLVHTYADYYNSVRPHQGKDNKPLGHGPEPPNARREGGQVACRSWLGGLLRHYHRDAA